MWNINIRTIIDTRSPLFGEQQWYAASDTSSLNNDRVYSVEYFNEVLTIWVRTALMCLVTRRCPFVRTRRNYSSAHAWDDTRADDMR